MPLACVCVPHGKTLAAVLNGRGHDFWVSCLAGVSTSDLPDKLATTRVEDEPVADIFTHCYCMSSDNIKRDADNLLNEFGLGLRKTRVKSQPGPGCVFVFINNYGESVLSKRRAGLSDTDKKLSSEERLRRTSLQFEISSLEQMKAIAKRNMGSFWASALGDTTVVDCAKKVITMTFENEPVDQRFSKCLIVEVRDCKEATERLAHECGLGLRTINVRSRRGPGCVILLLQSAGCGSSLPVAKKEPSPKKRKIDEASAPVKTTSSSMQPTIASGAPVKTTSSSMQPAIASGAPVKTTSSSTQPAIASGKENQQRPGTSQKVVDGKSQERTCGAAETSAPVDPEELYCKQVAALEKRLMTLLPTLSQEELASTSCVEARLEQAMKKPAGRLQKFHMEIGRMRRRFLASKEVKS